MVLEVDTQQTSTLLDQRLQKQAVVAVEVGFLLGL
jgi:hypothetical protein